MQDNTTVFIGNLAWSTTDEGLFAFASTAGAVVSAEVQCHADSGRSKGWGLVNFSDPATAAAAVETLNGTDLEGRAMHVRMDRSNIESSGGFAVFVGNLPWSATDPELSELFRDFEPYDAHVKTNMAGRSRGFAILRFADPEKGRSAIETMDGYDLDGRNIQVREDKDVRGADGEGGEARPSRAGRGGRGGGRGGGAGGRGGGGQGGGGGGGQGGDAPVSNASGDTLFVGNLAWATADEDLQTHFSAAGAVSSAQVQIASSGRSKGWGLVTYSTPEEANLAIETLHNSELHERQLIVRLDRR